MWQWERRHQLVLLVVAAMVLFIAGFKYASLRGQGVLASEQGLVGDGEGKASITATAPEEENQKEIVVHVAGAVLRPGVYRLPPGSRVVDAVDAAGTTSESALNYLNLAAQLEDGKQVYVFSLEEINQQEVQGSIATGINLAAPGMVNASGLININTASQAELEELPGVGPSIAQRIIDYRDQNGPFSAIEDIMLVSGIGTKRFEDIKNKICVH